MNVKQLKMYCTMQASREDKEILEKFIKKHKRETYKLIGIRATIMIILSVAFTGFIYAITGKMTVDTIRNLAPFYVLFAVFTAIVTFGMLINTVMISMRLKKALNLETGITVSQHTFCLKNIDREVVSVTDNSTDSTFYDFCSDDASGIKFSVGSRQVGCYFDEAETGKQYKLFCLLEKNIFFICTKSDTY